MTGTKGAARRAPPAWIWRAASSLPLPDYLDKVEREAILAALAKTGFNRTAAAKLLGVSFRTLRYRMQRLGIRDPGTDGG